jgi:hypothetical protein
MAGEGVWWEDGFRGRRIVEGGGVLWEKVCGERTCVEEGGMCFNVEGGREGGEVS